MKKKKTEAISTTSEHSQFGKLFKSSKASKLVKVKKGKREKRWKTGAPKKHNVRRDVISRECNVQGATSIRSPRKIIHDSLGWWASSARTQRKTWGARRLVSSGSSCLSIRPVLYVYYQTALAFLLISSLHHAAPSSLPFLP